jgi:hypothetical protein
MADRGDQLSVVGEFLYDLHRPVVQPQLVGIADAAGQQQRGIVLGVDLLHGEVRHDRAAKLRVVHHALDRIGLEAGQRHLHAGIEQRLTRFEEFGFLEPVGGEDQDVRGGKIGHERVPVCRENAFNDRRPCTLRNEATVCAFSTIR